MARSGLTQLYGERRKLRIPLPGGKGPMEISSRTVRRTATVGFVLLVLGLLAALINTILVQYDLERRDSHHELELLASLAATTLSAGQNSDTPQPPVAEALNDALPASAFAQRRVFLLVDANGIISGRSGDAQTAAALKTGQPLPEAMREALKGRHAQVVRVELNGESLLAAGHDIGYWPGRVVVLQPQTTMVADWDATSGTLIIIFCLLTALAIAALAFFNRQADRAEAGERERAAFSERLETALLLGRCGLWDWDVARGRIQLSAAMQQLLGLPPHKGYMDIGAFLALQHPEEEPVDRLLERMLEEGRTTFEHEMRLKEAGGQWLWFKIRGALSSDEDTRHLVGIAVDITAQKRAAAAMKAAERRLMEAIESISEAFVLWDDQMRLVLCNSKFREFHGLPEEACQPGMPHEQIMRQARTPKRIHKAQSIASDRNGGQEITWELELANGRWLKISERHIWGGGYVSVGTDITELKNKQMALERSEKELKKTVEALQQAREELQERNIRLEDMARRYLLEKRRAEDEARHKTRFLQHMSHELRTPLAPVVGMAEAMAKGHLGKLDEAAYRQYAELIHQSARRMLEMIDDLLAYAAIETGKVQPQRKATALEKIIEMVVAQYAPLAEGRGLKLRCEISEPVEADVDAELIAQALDKVVSNAVNFTQEGEICLKLEVASRKQGSAAQEVIVIEVRDTGCGMPPEKVEELMRPFERLGDAYQAHDGGTGLGLAIARALLAMHGGRLEVESAQGKGTTVRFILPGELMHRKPEAAE